MTDETEQWLIERSHNPFNDAIAAWLRSKGAPPFTRIVGVFEGDPPNMREPWGGENELDEPQECDKVSIVVDTGGFVGMTHTTENREEVDELWAYVRAHS